MSAFRDDRDGLHQEIAELRRRLDDAQGRARDAARAARRLRHRTVMSSLVVGGILGGLFGARLLLDEGQPVPPWLYWTGGGIFALAIGGLLGRRLRAGPAELEVLHEGGQRYVYVEPGDQAWTISRSRVGTLPAAPATLRLAARAIACTDGTLDLDATCVVTIGKDRAARDRARLRLLDRGPDDVAAEAAPLVEAAVRQAVGRHGRADAITALPAIGARARITAQGLCGELGLEVGPVVLTLHGGRVDLVG
ncbi:MAG: hypothetical protein H6709_01085 [Kofleriaceae bacterium]|nr:hypothetical protein [Kofleriaceae bacterium]MCB9570662.1 hypothetical protein [Kofleriaceae bacterium]